MILHFLTVFLRTIKKDKISYLIHVLGLSLGLSATAYLFLYCRDELTFDQFHPEHERLYKVVDTYTFSGPPVNSATVSAPMGPALVANLPEVEMAVRLNKVTGILRTEEEHAEDFQFDRILIADSGFFQMFGFSLLHGDPRSALSKPNSIVLTRQAAHRIFGSSEVLGKSIKTNLLGSKTMMITGVAADPPSNSHIQFDMLVSHVSMIGVVPTLDHWLVYGTHTYVSLVPETDPGALKPKMKELVLKNIGPELAAKYDHHAVPIASVHLGISRRSDLEPAGNAVIVKILIGVGILILLLSASNFISLSMSLAANRIKESGVRKTLGSSRNVIVSQFTAESFLLVLTCCAVAVGIAVVSLPLVNSVTGKSFDVSHILGQPLFQVILPAALGIGLISGLVPSLFLSRLHPVASLKNLNTSSVLSRYQVRNGVVVFQLSVVIALLISLDILQMQLKFLRSQDLGFSKDGVLVVPINSLEIAKSRIALKEELENLTSVLSVTTASTVPSKNFGFGPFRLDGGNSDDNAIFNIIGVDADFIGTMDLKMIAGRPFHEVMASDSSAFILNKAAADILGIHAAEKAIGKNLEMHGANNSGPLKKGPIIGISQNFNYKSLKEEVEPVVLHISKGGYGFFILKITADNISATINEVRTKWGQFEPNQTMTYSFLDEDIGNLYKAEEKLDGIFGLFTLLTILIGCIGLFGLSSYFALRKIKEISVRKVYGASINQIIVWIGSTFLRLHIIAFVLACPVAYYVGTKWLSSFAYHDTIGVRSFLLTGVVSFFIVIITISHHSIKASISNPIKTLRAE